MSLEQQFSTGMEFPLKGEFQYFRGCLNFKNYKELSKKPSAFSLDKYHLLIFISKLKYDTLYFQY